MPVERYSSRRSQLSGTFLNARLEGAVAYDRIAGYFRSSVFEVAGEAFEAVQGPIRIVCNSDLDPADVTTGRITAQAQRTEWCEGEPEKMTETQRPRYERLAKMLRSGQVTVRVLPDASFGLIHGKAGVIRYKAGRALSFIGSMNETREGWAHHYELLWEDDSEAAVRWVQEEFDTLWTHRDARDLSEAIVEDVERILARVVVPVADWKPHGIAEPQAPFVEAPVERRAVGLAPYQKAFVCAVMKEIETYGNARFLLADDVGLGKTVQLGMAAEIIALTSNKPVLVLAPKNLLPQWQDELLDMLTAPSARWEVGHWITEDGSEWPGPADCCPRRIGLFPTSLIIAGSESVEPLLDLRYACVVLDEAHRARQSRVLGADPSPTKLLRFMGRIASRAETLLLGTATPIQTHREELFDLMRLLANGCERVLGGPYAPWNSPTLAMDLVSGHKVPSNYAEIWSWLHSPLPSRGEDQLTERIRDELALPAHAWQAPFDGDRELSESLRISIEFEGPRALREHNPFVRHVIKRRRRDLRHPDGMPYFPDIGIRLHGEGVADALEMPPNMTAAYEDAREFCVLVSRLHPSAGLLKTLLLRRIGSSLRAGLRTAEKLLERERRDEAASEEDEDLTHEEQGLTFGPEEAGVLRRASQRLRDAGNDDPKLVQILARLRRDGWRERGCILFSQYKDTALWTAEQLSAAFPNDLIGVYGGGGDIMTLLSGVRQSATRREIQAKVRDRSLRILVATDAASEGLNLQRLQTLVNIDLPWNPARLEQRKGRIERIGQEAPVIDILNLRYRGSVEDDVHATLSHRLQQIRDVFGTVPDTLEDVWVKTAQGQIEEAKLRIEELPRSHPFDVRYAAPAAAREWDKSSRVLDRADILSVLRRPWK
jgi:superfamily II DNA or RNA helicase